MKRTPIALLVAGAFALAACGGPSTGVVVDKAYAPGYWYMSTGYWSGGTCVSYYKGRCTARSARIFHPGHMVYQPDVWKMKLRDHDQNWTRVPESSWQSCTVGQTYNGTRCES